MSSLARWAPPLIAATVLALLVAAGDRELHTYHLHDILRSLASLSTGHLLAALALTVVGHLVHVGYDLLALRYAGLHHGVGMHRVSFRGGKQRQCGEQAGNKQAVAKVTGHVGHKIFQRRKRTRRSLKLRGV